jgi:hypothetical protein
MLETIMSMLPHQAGAIGKRDLLDAQFGPHGFGDQICEFGIQADDLLLLGEQVHGRHVPGHADLHFTPGQDPLDDRRRRCRRHLAHLGAPCAQAGDQKSDDRPFHSSHRYSPLSTIWISIGFF